MGQIKFDGLVQAPIDKTFDTYTDFGAVAERVPDITKVELVGGEAGQIGALWSETRIMFGKEATEVLEVTDVTKPTRFAIGCESCGSAYETVYTFAPEGNATRVSMVTTVKPLTLVAKLMTPIAFLMSGVMKKCLLKDFEALKPHAEGT